MKKIGLVVEGGGMKCAYSAGILDRFLDDNISFDYAIGVSAGSANTATFLARQRGRNKRFYTEYLNDPEYLGIKNYLENGEVFGLQYIYGTLSNSDGKDPIDFEALMANPTDFEVVATDAWTGKPTYFGKDMIKQDDYSIIMASSALPVACQPVRINNRFYYDGGVSDAIPVKRAFEKGCDKIVVISSKPYDFVKNPEGARVVYKNAMKKKFPNMITAIDNRHLMYRRCSALMRKYEKDGKAFIFAPSNPPKMSTYAKDKEIEEELYNLGLSDYDKLRDDLQEFLN